MSKMHKLNLPKNVARWYDPFLYLFTIISGLLFFKSGNIESYKVILIICFINIFIFSLLELRNLKYRIYGKNLDKNKEINKEVYTENNFEKTVFMKWVGVLLGIFSLLFLWWLFPIYASKYHEPLWKAILIILPFTIIFSYPFIYFTEKKLGKYRDTYYEFGLFTYAFFNNKYWYKIDWDNFKQGVLAWFVRGFFLPMNYCTAVSIFEKLRNIPDLNNFLINAPIAISYPTIENIIYLFLIIAIIPGYYFTSRLLGTSAIKVSDSWPAWVVSLWFYPPFNSMANNAWFDYSDELIKGQQNWITVFQNSPTTIYFLAFVLLSMAVIHYFGEAMLGMRASVNTNKGIITNNVFKYTKHPIYLSKNIAWFLATLPFMSSVNFFQNIKYLIAFLCVATGYILRGYFEEKLLSEDETYVEYAKYIDKHGIFAWFGKLFPIFTFEWRYDYWKNIKK